MNYPPAFQDWLEEKVNIEALKRDFVAGEDIPAGAAVCMHTDGFVYKYTTLTQDQYIGVAKEDIAEHCKCTIVLNGYLKVAGSGWQKGVVYYVTNGGGLVAGSGDAKIAVGVGRHAIVIFNNLSEIDYFILTTLGNSGPATLTGGNQLNIPTYSLVGLGGVPVTRTLTINGVTYDLTADRAWTIDALPPQAGHAGEYLTTDGTNPSWAVVDLSAYVPITRTLTINGTALDLTADRSWSVGTVTSIGMTVPDAFSVTPASITTSGTFAISAIGAVSQYIRGDGTLSDFPSPGGGSSVNYYINGGTNQGVFGGNTYYQMSKTADTGLAANFSRNTNGYIAEFITDAGDPSLLTIPGGSWNIQFYMNVSSAGGSPNFYVELYKYDGVVFTLIATSSSSPELITGGTAIDLYYTSISVPPTTLLVTDRLAIRVYTNVSGRTVNLYTQDSRLGLIQTTFSTGMTALNGLIDQVQYLTTGVAGADFNISSAAATHTFNLPVASAVNTGKLSSGDWSIFNAKEPAIVAGTTAQYWRGDKSWQTLDTLAVPENTNLYYTDARARAAISLTTTGSSGASTYSSLTGILNVPTYTLSGLGGVPTSRTLTINGTAYDLSADRSWSVGTVTSVAALTLGTTGTDLSSSVATSTTTPVITLNVPTASATNRGALSSADWTTFNNKPSGTGAAGQITYWSGTSTQTGSATLTYTPTSQLLINNSVTAAAAIARGMNMTPTLTAAANNDVLVGLDISPTFTNGAFTGVSNYAFRVNGVNGFIYDQKNSRINFGDVSGITYPNAFQVSIPVANYGGAIYGENTSTAADGYIAAKFVARGSSVSSIGGNTELSLQQKNNTNNNLAVFNFVNASSAGGTFFASKFVNHNAGGSQTSDFLIGTVSAGTQSTKFYIFANGNTLIQSGGTFTDAGYKLDVTGTCRLNGQVTVTGSTTASAGVARGEYNTATLVAAANNDVLVGLDVAPTFTNGAFTGVTNYAARFSDNTIVTKSQNAVTSFTVFNGTSGTAAQAQLTAQTTSSTAFTLGKVSAGFTTYKTIVAGDGHLYNSSGGDISILNDNASGAIKLAAGGSSTAHVYLASTGNIGVGTTTTTTARLTLTGSQTASGSIARGQYNTPTLVAAANNDVLVALDVAPTYTPGAFTGLTRLGLRVQDGGASLNTNTAGSNALAVTGTSGQLLTVSDTATGDIFQVNNSGGTPLFKVNSSGVYIPSSTAVTGVSASPTTLYAVAKTLGTAAFFDYVLWNPTTTAYRAGTLTAVWDGTNVSYNETATPDLNASTAAVTLSASISGANIRVVATITSGTWNFKIGARFI